ncbi:hypothetical protein O9929_14200 [Vibrio lentus]|nr:hypothetical protein [Vibrio lentus]
MEDLLQRLLAARLDTYIREELAGITRHIRIQHPQSSELVVSGLSGDGSAGER